MGFIITDLADDKKALPVNFWNWHPTVELVKSLGVVDSKRIELMHQQCVGTVVTQEEARCIAQGLQRGILARLQAGERVRLDLSTTSEPDDGTLHRGDAADKNYSATSEWLGRFAQFCSECHGFQVL
jgi:hypothetical protein